MIRRDAIFAAVTNLGIGEGSAEHIARILFVIQVDNFLADRRAQIEEIISVFVENSQLHSRGLITLDDVLSSIVELKRLLTSLKLMYTVMPAEVNLSSHLDSVKHIFTRAFERA